MSAAQIIKTVKNITAKEIYKRFPEVKEKLWGGQFWSDGYYVSTVGLNEATVKKYIREQELHDQMKDKLSVKEYEDPFKGSK